VNADECENLVQSFAFGEGQEKLLIFGFSESNPADQDPQEFGSCIHPAS